MTDEEIIAKDFLPDCDLPLWRAVELAAWKYACLTNLPLKAVEPMRRRKATCAGLCFQQEGRVQILIRKKTTKRGVWAEDAESGLEIVDTLAHELAHLADQTTEGHSLRWKLEFGELKEQMLDDGLDAEFDRLRV